MYKTVAKSPQKYRGRRQSSGERKKEEEEEKASFLYTIAGRISPLVEEIGRVKER